MNSLIKAFVPKAGKSVSQYYNHLIQVLQSADIGVFTNQEEIGNTQCAIHIIGNEYHASEFDPTISEEQFWLQQSYLQKGKNKKYRIFIWQPETISLQEISAEQSLFINSIRNNLIQNVAFCNHNSPILFVEDIRSIIHEEQPAEDNIKQSNIFFIHNEIDEEKGKGIVELLSDVVKVEKLNLSLRSEIDYLEFIVRQIQNSQLTVVYFNHTGNWALPFIQQIWKNTGGASTNKTMVLIGDTEHEQNKNLSFDAPNVINISTSTELIPLEIKVLFDKLFSN